MHHSARLLLWRCAIIGQLLRPEASIVFALDDSKRGVLSGRAETERREGVPGQLSVYQIECFMLPATHVGQTRNEPKILVTPTFLLLARFNLFSLDQIKTDDATSHNYSGIHKYVHTLTHTHTQIHMPYIYYISLHDVCFYFSPIYIVVCLAYCAICSLARRCNCSRQCECSHCLHSGSVERRRRGGGHMLLQQLPTARGRRKTRPGQGEVEGTVQSGQSVLQLGLDS